MFIFRSLSFLFFSFLLKTIVFLGLFISSVNTQINQIGSWFVFYSHFNWFFFQKREKRRWNFRKPNTTNQLETVTHQNPVTTKPTTDSASVVTKEQKHALDVAVATAQATMATDQAAVKVGRLSRPDNRAREHQATIVIQTAFRGYLVIIELIRSLSVNR